MEKIASFTVDHNRLLRGIYVSRKDKIGSETLTSFDVRMKEPNREPVLGLPEIHTMEHLGATFLRSHPEWKDRTIYFGPMGCTTGHYVIFSGDLNSEDVVQIFTEMFEFMTNFEGNIPGNSAIECGNYLGHNLSMAKWEAKKYLQEVLYHLKEENLNYPE